MVTAHDPVELVVQLRADNVPAPPVLAVIAKEMVTPWTLLDNCAVSVEVVAKSAGTDVRLAVRVMVPNVTVVVADV